MEKKFRIAVRAEGGGLDFVLSDGALDRHGTRIDPKGWKLDNFKRNPIALFGHDSDSPIGSWENVRNVGDKLIGTLAFAAEGTSARIDELRKLVEQNVLRAVSVGFYPLKYGQAGKDEYDYVEQELLECSLVSVGSNPNALAQARALNISDETISLAFGEHAATRRGMDTIGKQAAASLNEARLKSGLPSLQKGIPMKTLAQRIEDAQNDLTAKKDRLVELNATDTLDLDAIEALNVEIETAERTVAALKTSEQRIGINAAQPAKALQAPSVSRRPLGVSQRELSGTDLVVRAMVVRGLSHFCNRTIDSVLEDRYPGHEATAIMTRADQTIGTTTVSGWASEIVQTAYGDFMQALTGLSIYPALRSKGIGLSFDGVGTVSIPGRSAGGAGGSFFAEGAPMRVGRITTTAVTLTPRKMGVIVAFSRELAKRSTPAIESLVRQAILEDTAAVLDPIILDAVAGDTVRPAGLLNGVAAVAAGYGGGDYAAVIEDFAALLAPFIAANAADNITVIMNPSQGLRLAMMPGPIGQPNWFSEIQKRVNIIESTHATAGRLIAIRNSDFVTANGDAPEFDISEQATVHMEDTTPLEIVSGTGPTTADPVRSFFQTATVGVRMITDLTWKMRRSGMVQWINGTSW